MIIGGDSPEFPRKLMFGGQKKPVQPLVFFTGDKWESKKYRNHSGYPGGLRERTLLEMLAKYPQELVFRIIKGMMPHTKLGDKQLKRLFIYPTSSHPHQAQVKKFVTLTLK